MMSIRRDRLPSRYACLAALGLLAATGCGDDRPMVATPTGPHRPPAAATRLADMPTPPSPGDDADPLAPPDPMIGSADGNAADALASDTDGASPVPQTDAGTDLGTTAGPKMPTQHSHWLSLAQFGARVTVRLNGVWYGEFYGPTLRDITMRLQPGPNTLTVTYAPQNASSWLAVHVTEGEHSPPIPDLVVYRIEPLRQTGKDDMTGQPAPTTRTFRFIAQ